MFSFGVFAVFCFSSLCWCGLFRVATGQVVDWVAFWGSVAFQRHVWKADNQLQHNATVREKFMFAMIRKSETNGGCESMLSLPKYQQVTNITKTGTNQPA